MSNRKPKVLLIAEAANPEWVSVPLEGWSHSKAIAELVDAHMVTHVRNEEAIRKVGWGDAQFTALDNESVARPVHNANEWLRKVTGLGWTFTTATASLSFYKFEHELWKAFGPRITNHEFDLVHRITPLSPTIPSFFMAKRCRAVGVPFVWGPVNGGVPWPPGFGNVQRAEGEWLSYVRNAHKLLPGFHRTRRDATALIAGSRSAWEQFAGFHDKCVYIPENAVAEERFTAQAQPQGDGPLRIAFVGRLVPYKGADMLLEAAAPLIREGKLVVDIIGDGPEMGRLKQIRETEDLGPGALLEGWLPHRELQHRLAKAQVFGFPSIREFGGTVCLEAMVLGLVPVVVGYAGPDELVTDQTGIRVPIGNRSSVVAGFRAAFEQLLAKPERLRELSTASRDRVKNHFTWRAKAAQTVQVYRWVLGERGKPDFGMPLPDDPAASQS